jgi:hypothetical protein
MLVRRYRLGLGPLAGYVGGGANWCLSPPSLGLLTADRNGSQLARVGHATWPDADE